MKICPYMFHKKKNMFRRVLKYIYYTFYPLFLMDVNMYVYKKILKLNNILGYSMSNLSFYNEEFNIKNKYIYNKSDINL